MIPCSPEQCVSFKLIKQTALQFFLQLTLALIMKSLSGRNYTSTIHGSFEKLLQLCLNSVPANIRLFPDTSCICDKRFREYFHLYNERIECFFRRLLQRALNGKKCTNNIFSTTNCRDFKYKL